MNPISIRELRNHGGEVVERVMAGESVTITRSGTPVAELRPLRRRGLDRATLVQRWRHLPPVDPAMFRADVDAAMDSTL